MVGACSRLKGESFSREASNAVSVCNLLQVFDLIHFGSGIEKLGHCRQTPLDEGALPILYVQANPWILSPGGASCVMKI